MKTLYLVTGADGHLGSTIVRLLKKQNLPVRGLLLPGISCHTHRRHDIHCRTCHP